MLALITSHLSRNWADDMKPRWIWLSVLVPVLLGSAGAFLVCPPSWFHNRWPGEDISRDRICTATANKKGELAVAIKSRGRTRVFLVSYDNVKAIELTSGTLDADPAWDSSGSRLAYVTFVSRDTFALHVMVPTTGSKIPILQQRLISQPQWSRDGRYILFLHGITGDDGFCVDRVCLSTRSVECLAHIKLGRPQSWALLPDDDTVVYPADGSIWGHSISRGSIRRLPIKVENPCMVSVSPDGKYLFVCESHTMFNKKACIVDLNTWSHRFVAVGYIRHALWSPDSKYLAVANKSSTTLCSTPSGTPAPHRVYEGVASCWRSVNRLVLIKPDMVAPFSLVETDIMSGKNRVILSVQAEPHSK